jgi:20S proteasome alpha/beta subunit
MSWKAVKRQLFVILEKNDEMYRVRFGRKVMYQGFTEYLAELVYQVLVHLQVSIIFLILTVIAMGYYMYTILNH